MKCLELLRVLESGLQAQELPDGLESANEAFGDAKSVRHKNCLMDLKL